MSTVSENTKINVQNKMREPKDFNMDEYVRQTIRIAETKTGNDRFILIYGLFQSTLGEIEIMLQQTAS